MTDRAPDVLYYPFHLCHPQTLQQMLDSYGAVHFRDYMALQLTPMAGTTAASDRMGDAYPDLVAEGRLVQGHRVSGPLDAVSVQQVDRDLADREWRATFHQALVHDRRFQRGIFDPAHSMRIAGTIVPGPAALLRLMGAEWADTPFTFDRVAQLAHATSSLEQAFSYEYGLALVKTSASQVHTIRLAEAHHLSVVTDSSPHFALLERTLLRTGLQLRNRLLPRSGY